MMKESTSTPAYSMRLKAERADELYLRIVAALTKKKRYRDPEVTAGRLAGELGTNRRYISAAIVALTGSNFNALLNSLRLRDACRMLGSAKCRDMTVEEIGLLSGFASRQAFYKAFSRIHQSTPLAYRKALSNSGAPPDAAYN